jgi:hypothetical protein
MHRIDKYFRATLFKKWHIYWSSCHIRISLFCEICGSPSYSSICHLLHAGFLAYSLTLKMEATYSFEMSVYFQQTMSNYIPEARTLHEKG